MNPITLLSNTTDAAEDTLRILAGDKPVNFLNPEIWPAALKRRAALGAHRR